MITPKKGRIIFVLATWAITVHYNFPGCSAWTMEPSFRHRWHHKDSRNHIHNHNYNHNHNNPKRHESSLFLATASAAPSATATSSETTATFRDLFPASDTITNGTLQAGESHTLYYEIHGTGPLTALFLHGGPGAGCFPNHARFFDPSRYTIVLLDQRGAGKSTPRGSVEDNTLNHLVEDCERLRQHLNPRLHNASSNSDSHNSETRPWDVVLGGSWGATLGLAYAQKHPSALRSLVLRGICTLRPSEVDWLFGAKGGSAAKQPEAWKNFSDAVDCSNSDSDGDHDDGREALHAHYDCLFNVRTNGTANNALRMAAARSWMMWEMGVTSSAAPTGNTDNNTNQSNPSGGTVLVSSPEHDGGKWRFENHLGAPMPMPMGDGMDRSPEMAAALLRRDIDTDTKSGKGQPPMTGPRPVRPIGESMPLLKSIREASKGVTNNNKTSVGRFRLPPDYVPAQAMLTCYYSVNDRFVMGNSNLLERNASNNNITPVKIIGIQGGKDPICPPDTALDLLRSLQASSNTMELRIPLESGHSMYDPVIKHELVTVTDRLADEFLNQS